MSEPQAADIDLAVSTLIRECERIEGAIPNRRPGRDAEILKVTVCLLHMFMILQTGKRIKRSYKAASTQDFAVWFFRFADPDLKESTTVYAIKEYLRGYGEDEARYLLGDDEEFNRAYKEKIQRILQIGQNLTDSQSF